MSRIPYTLRLSGPSAFGREAPATPVGKVVSRIASVVKQAISMGFVGRSSPPGRPRGWLSRAADVRFVGLAGDDQGGTLLHLEAPRLGDAAEKIYRQREFWPTRPDGDDTGLDLLGDALGDVASGLADSDRFDPPFLQRISQFARVFQQSYDLATLIGHRFGVDSPALLDASIATNARRLVRQTPAPRMVRVVGMLAMIRVGGGFELTLDDGSHARAVLLDGHLADHRDLFNRRILVQGQAIYRPSGRLLRIDARTIAPGDDEPSLWSKIPTSLGAKLDLRKLHRESGPTGGVSAFFGIWPGNESEQKWARLVGSLD